MSEKRHIHLGLGRFHRAHQACYLQNAGYRVTAFSMRTPTEAKALREGDHQYELVVCGQGKQRSEVITAIDEALFIGQDEARFLELMKEPEVSTVTLTITEKGYIPDGLAISLLARGIAHRQSAHSVPINILSCDNLSGNGDLLQRLCEEASQTYDRELVGFPNTMVDRIVPSGENPLVIRTEAFHQWIIEDRFQGPRPAWDQPGLMFVKSVEPFEKIKLCLLNASHSFMAYYAQLQGHEFVHQAIRDPAIATLVRRLYFEEVGPLLKKPESFDLQMYGEALMERFDNPDLPHRLDQIAMDGSVKIPHRFLAFHKESSVLQLAVQSWFRYMWLGLSDREHYKISDPKAAEMKTLMVDDFTKTVNLWTQFLAWC